MRNLIKYGGWSVFEGGDFGYTELAGIMLKLGNAEMNTEVQEWDLVEKELRGAWLKFGERENLCEWVIYFTGSKRSLWLHSPPIIGTRILNTPTPFLSLRGKVLLSQYFVCYLQPSLALSSPLLGLSTSLSWPQPLCLLALSLVMGESPRELSRLAETKRSESVFPDVNIVTATLSYYCLQDLFSSFYFQPIWVFNSKVYLLWRTCNWTLCF